MFVQMRRSLTGKTRWVLTPVIAVLVLASTGATYSNIARTAGVSAQNQLAALSSNVVHRTVDSTHEGLLEDVRPAAESVRAITEVVSSVRTGTPLHSR